MGCVTLKFKNTGIANTNVIVSVTADPAVTYDSHITATGTFDPVAGEWTIGDFNQGDQVQLDICYTGPDGAYEVAWDLNGDKGNSAASTGVCALVIAPEMEDGDPCNPCVPPTASPLDDTYYAIQGCIGGNDSINNQGCHIEYTVLPANQVNIGEVILDIATGCYKLTPACLTTPWSFDYEIRFSNCPADCYPDGAVYGPFGPATVSGEAVIDCSLFPSVATLQTLPDASVDVVTGDTIDITTLPGYQDGDEVSEVYRNGSLLGDVDYTVVTPTTFTVNADWGQCRLDIIVKRTLDFCAPCE